MKVLSDGRVQSGLIIESSNDADQVITMNLFGKNGDMRSGSKLAFGDFGQYSHQGMNVFLGEYGDNDTDQLWLHGKLGFFLTSTGYANKVIAYYNPSASTNFVFNTNLLVNGISVTSDARLKDNIQSIENPLDFLSQINGVSYTYRLSEVQKAQEPEESKFSNTTNMYVSSTTNVEVSIKETEYSQIQQQINQKEEADADRKRIGFLAQDVQKILPELVQENQDGSLSIDYIGFIPLIVESIKEMQQTILNQQEQIEALQTLLSLETKTQLRSTTSTENVNVLGFGLKNEKGSLISYNLPEKFTTATLQIFDISGRILKEVELLENKGVIDIKGSEIGYGTFIYVLVVDGKKIDSLKKYLN